MKKRQRRSKRTGFAVGDDVEARIGDDWHYGKVSRSLHRGVEVDVRLENGKVMTNLTAKDLRPRKLFIEHFDGEPDE